MTGSRSGLTCSSARCCSSPATSSTRGSSAPNWRPPTRGGLGRWNGRCPHLYPPGTSPGCRSSSRVRTTMASLTRRQWPTLAPSQEHPVAVRARGYETGSPADVALDARVVSVGIWLFLAADAFFFAGWYFAFFYLRALNNNQAWIIQGLTRPNRGY